MNTDKQLIERAEIIDHHTTELRAAEGDLLMFETKLKDAAVGWAWAAITVGRVLCKIKASIPHGHYEEWVENNAKKSSDTCAVYVRMMKEYDAATETERARLLETGSIRSFFKSLNTITTEKIGETPKHSPAWLAICDSIQKLKDRYIAHSSEFTPEGTEKLKAEVQPIAEKLWPEKFA